MFGRSEETERLESQDLAERMSKLAALLDEDEAEAATKGKQRPRRDSQGRRIDKPYGGSKREEPGTTRDAEGYRKNKPFARRER